MIYIVAFHDSGLSEEEYKNRLYLKYSFLKSDLYDVKVYNIGQIESLPLEGSDYRHVYFDDDSIKRNDDRVLQALIKFSNAKQIWISLKNSVQASTNPSKSGKRNKTYTRGQVKTLKTG